MSPKPRGFTLIEVLIALAILAVISILAWRGLEEVLRLANRVDEVDQQLQTQTAVFSQLEKDLLLLDLGNTNAKVENKASIDESGLFLLVTQRPEGQAAYQEEIRWVLDNGNLFRLSKRAADPESPMNRSEPIAMQGMQLRLWVEPGGWTALSSYGTPQNLGDFAFDLQGRSNTLTANNAQTNTSMTRAVEVSLTHNKQALRRVFLTGGLK